MGRSISQLLLWPHAPNIFWRFLWHIETFLDHLGCWHTNGQSTCTHKPGQVEQIHGGVGRSISQLLLGHHAQNVLWRFLRHEESFLDHVGGVATPAGRVLVPRNLAKLSKYMGNGEVNISASIMTPCTKHFLEVPVTHRTFLDHLGWWHTNGQSTCTHKPGQIEQITWGSGEVNISASIRVTMHKMFFGGFSDMKNHF